MPRGAEKDTAKLCISGWGLVLGYVDFSGDTRNEKDGDGEYLFPVESVFRCDAYENIIFCWVMHEQGIIDGILSELEAGNCLVHTISLVCDLEELRKRLQKDIEAGIRSEDVIQRSIARIGMYEELDTEKIDVTHITPEQTAEKIILGEKG